MNERRLIDFFALQNKWWFDRKDFPIIKTHNIKRSDYYYIYKNHLRTKEAIVIIGPRGVGKSTILFETMGALLGLPEQKAILEKEKLPEELLDSKRVLYVTFEDPTLKKWSLLDVLSVYAKYVLNEDISKLKKQIYVFFDEIQNVRDWGDQLKVIQDLVYPIKFFVSGSSSVAMGNEASKGARRFKVYDIYPLKFSDFLRFKIADENFDNFLKKIRHTRQEVIESYQKANGQLIYDIFLRNYNNLKPWQTQVELFFQEYLIKGGYPEFVNETDYSKYASKLNETFRLGFHKDLIYGAGIGDPKSMLSLTEYLASISSCESNYTSIMNNSKATTNTGMLKKYLYHLEKSFLLGYSYQFSGGSAKKSSAFKVYLIDIAIRNMLQGLLNELLLKEDEQIGYVLETMIYEHTHRFYHKIKPDLPIYYWKDKKGRLEADIILKLNGNKIPIEVKKADFPKLADVKGLRAFCKKHKVPGIVLCGQKFTIKEGIIFLPHWLFLLIC